MLMLETTGLCPFLETCESHRARAQTAYNVDVDELNSTIDTMETTLETYSNEVIEQIEYLENKISSLQTIILFAYIVIAATVIGGFYFIKRMR